MPSTPRSDQAVALLRRRIIDGEYEPGTLLAETAVARDLGVSRVPVREALFALERDGLVDFSETGRAYVKDLSPRDFEELYTFRLSLEPIGARLAAPALSKDSSRLDGNIKATSKAPTVLELTNLDLDFHEIILEASGNGRLLKQWHSLRSQLELWLGRLNRLKQLHTPGMSEATVGGHKELVKAFKTKSPDECERLMSQHILGWHQWLPTMEVPE
ncbi:MAG: GntR family transcriptional regulator [Verrucomicrobiota bacterium]